MLYYNYMWLVISIIVRSKVFLLQNDLQGVNSSVLTVLSSYVRKLPGIIVTTLNVEIVMKPIHFMMILKGK